jgi:L-threonylcarbamoyladenylate synthase
MVVFDTSSDSIINASKLLLNGNIVAFPTETVYGLGADGFNPEAIKKIYQIKNRPLNNPLILHCASIEIAKQVVLDPEIFSNPIIKKLTNKFWPGPLSILFAKSKLVPDIVTAGHSKVAIRIPNHKIALELLTLLGKPIAAPSANPSEYLSPTTAQHVVDSFGAKCPVVLNGGSCRGGLESTVIEVLPQEITVLRHGMVTVNELKQVSGLPIVGRKRNDSILSPGLLSKHYAPKTRLKYLDNFSISEIDETVAVVLLRESDKATLFAEKGASIYYLSKTGELAEIAHNLFAILRVCDEKNFTQILIEPCSDEGLGNAITDRLSRAVEVVNNH